MKNAAVRKPLSDIASIDVYKRQHRGYSKGKNKAIQGLMRLGYSFGESLAAVERIEAELADEQQD